MTHEQSQKEWAIKIEAYAWVAERANGKKAIEPIAERLIKRYSERSVAKTPRQGELAL